MGSGRLLETLSGRGWAVAGVDSLPRMVELARMRVPEARLTLGPAERLPWADGEFDAAVIVGVLAYTDPEATLAELVRVVRPGGRLVIGFRNRAAPVYAWRHAIVHPLARAMKRIVPFGRPIPGWRSLSLAQIRGFLSAHGLIIELIDPAGAEVIPDPLDRLVPALAQRAAEAAERRPRVRRTLGSTRLILARHS
jgi:SAM-dependent methyltransferase